MYNAVILCPIGAEHLAGQEVKRQGGTLTPPSLLQRSKTPGRVYFNASLDTLYKLLLSSRLSNRILLLAACFKATNFDELYNYIRKIKWDLYIKKSSKVIINKVRISSSQLASEHAVQKVAAKAVYDALMAAYSMHSVNGSCEVNIRVYLDNDIASVLLDLTGEPLYKRGYRINSGTAPLRETLAALLLQLSLWRRAKPLVDPFCGSATILLEAYLYAINFPAGSFREFAIKDLKIHDERLFLEVKRTLLKEVREEVSFSIQGFDIDKKIVEGGKENFLNLYNLVTCELQKVGKEPPGCKISLTQSNFLSLEENKGRGLICTNPPYGERLCDSESAVKLYKDMSALHSTYSNYEYGVLTTNKEFDKFFWQGREEREREGRTLDIKKIKDGNFDRLYYVYK